MRINALKDVPTYQLKIPDQWFTPLSKFLKNTSLKEVPQS